MTNSEKPHLNLAMIGPTGAGKSTISGHLFKLTNNLPESSFQKWEKETQELGKPDSRFAWAMYNLKAEKSQDVTIDVTIKPFQTKKQHLSLLDLPGHSQYIANLVSGVSCADAAILTINPLQGFFESDIGKEGKILQQALLAYTLGVQQIIVCVNKQDDSSISYS